ncbi:MAG: peptidoglycan-binding protein [Chthoniobacterales bacterium]|nr:peptidoglycan-binding protein [Chthoniobacterales bacterium]
MKKLILLALALSLSLAQVVRADNDNENDRNNKKKRSHQAATAAVPGQTVRRPVGQVGQPALRGITPSRSYVSPQRSYASTGQTYNNRAYPNRGTANSLNRNGDRGRPVTNARTTNVSRQSAGLNRASRNFNRNSYSVARSRVIRTYHDRGWWRSHYNTTFVLFGGGYYYWDSGYWYPAFGYSPFYNNYAYSEPIYGYNNLAPGQVLENVQLALRDQGYYQGPIDGLIGPQTRDALAAFQRDNGLVETAAVDEPTLVTLGLA